MTREKLKKVRLYNNKTMQEVADEVGITKPYYWAIENGRRRIYYDLAVKIAQVFGMKPDDIFLHNELTIGERPGCDINPTGTEGGN